jgi:N-acetylglucosamine-6-phosphate deacetylase
VFLSGGRIVSVDPSVGTRGTGLGGPGGRSENGTVGAGAERSVVDVSVQDDAVPAAGDQSPVAGGRPAWAASGATTTLDATDLLVAPGFVDLQCNGALGIDLATEPERLWDLAAALPRWGVTAWLPTVVTVPPTVRARALAAVRSGPQGDDVAVAAPLGLHVEGPFLAPERRGAHDPRHLAAPSATLVEDEDWSRPAGVALVTLAPELPGALDLVRLLTDRGVVVSAGHSSATADEARAAVDAGVRYVTHLFNAMAPLHHREPGLVGVALTDERLRVGLIADGLHVDPVVVALVARALGDRLSLVTDAVAALGAPPGPTRLGALAATVSTVSPAEGTPTTDSPAEGSPAAGTSAAGPYVAGSPAARPSAADAVRLADGTLAGSTLSLDRAVRNLVDFAGVSMADAVRAVTSTPAAVLGLTDRGVVAPGAVGDLVLLTPAGEVVATVIGGRVAYHARRPQDFPAATSAARTTDPAAGRSEHRPERRPWRS